MTAVAPSRTKCVKKGARWLKIGLPTGQTLGPIRKTRNVPESLFGDRAALVCSLLPKSEVGVRGSGNTAAPHGHRSEKNHGTRRMEFSGIPSWVRRDVRFGTNRTSDSSFGRWKNLGIFHADVPRHRFRPIPYNPYCDVRTYRAFKSSFVVIWLIRLNASEPHL